MNHNGVLQLDGQLASVLFLLVIVNQLARFPQLIIMGLGQPITDDVVKSWLFSVWVHKDHLLFRQSVVKLYVFLPQVFQILDCDVIKRNGGPAFGIGIDSVVHQERVMVDHRSSTESLDNKLVTIVHLMSDFYQSTLKNVHFIRESIDSVK